MTDTGGRARLNVEAFIAGMLERVPLPAVARNVEIIAGGSEHALRESIRFKTWHHDGIVAFIEELAGRLMPASPAPGRAEALLEDVEVWANSSGTFPGEMLCELRRFLGPERCGACRSGPPCVVHRERTDDEVPP